MVSPADAARFARAVSGIRPLIERDLEAFFQSLNLNSPERARDELLEFMPILITQYGEAASSVAADWFEETRFNEGVRGSFRAALFESPYMTAIEPSTRRVAGELFTDNPLAALEGLNSFAGKYALGAGRETVRRNAFRDPASGGWQRVAVGKTCDFCLLLVGRGARYQRETAFFASHGSCDCAAVPSWDKSAPEVEVDVYAVSRRTTGMRPAEKRRHNEAIRRAIAEYVV